MYLKDELLIMRENYHKNPLKKIHLKRPSVLQDGHPLARLFQDQEKLLREGEVHYAHIVQANSNLFKFFPCKNFPAQVLFSTEPSVDELPLLLRELCRRIYQYKDKPLETVPEQYREMVEVVADEYDSSSFSFMVPLDGQDAQIFFIPTMIHRKLLPGRVLRGGFLPVLAHKDCRSVLILPEKYWSKAFKRLWLAGKL